MFYVGISSVSIKLKAHYMAAWGYEFYLLVLKVEDKILIPKRPRNILFV